MADAPAAGSATQSPTFSMAATQAGMILGTAAYMSPEQAKGFQADTRSDVFSFGVMLYEMLTGRQAFPGDTVPEVLASVLGREPDLDALPLNLNPRLVELLKRCLEKNPKRRWLAVGDLRFEIEAIAAQPHATPTPPAQPVAVAPPPRALWKRAIPIAGSAMVAAVLAGYATWTMKPTPPLTITRFPFILPDGQQFSGVVFHFVAISPDGTRMLYGANLRLHVRSMSDLEARPISGTENLSALAEPVFSPDGGSVVFWAGDQTLKKVGVTGSAAVTICPAEAPQGVSWGPDGIVFGQPRGIMRVSPNGGKPELLIPVKGDEQVGAPHLLPGGNVMLGRELDAEADVRRKQSVPCLVSDWPANRVPVRSRERHGDLFAGRGRHTAGRTTHET
ncbi:MAG: protein kinase [Acidobacteria bacterium]|nr:protein kinase [Acidobacteriota bacterium]